MAADNTDGINLYGLDLESRQMVIDMVAQLRKKLLTRETILALDKKELFPEEIIREMSALKKEPEWMLEFRLKAYQRFLARPMPTWGGGGALDEIDFDDDDVVRELKQVDRILAPLASRMKR